MVNDAVVVDNHTIGVKYARSEELLFRWCEVSAIADSIFRTHPGLIPDSSAQVGLGLFLSGHSYDDSLS